MREVIKAKLSEQIPAIAGRCLDVHEAAADTTKPYLVVSQRDETFEGAACAYRRKYRIHLYADPAQSFTDLDDLSDQALSALHNVLLTDDSGRSAACAYAGSRWADLLDPDLGAITRSLDFRLNGLERPDATLTEDEDAWLADLAQWTEAQMGAEWQVYRTAWPTDLRMPAVLWRVTRMSGQAVNKTSWQLRKTLTGHVLGRTAREQQEAVGLLAGMLAQTVKIDGADPAGRKLTVAESSADPSADGWSVGQVRLKLTQRMTAAQSASAEGPLIAAVHATESIDE